MKNATKVANIDYALATTKNPDRRRLVYVLRMPVLKSPPLRLSVSKRKGASFNCTDICQPVCTDLLRFCLTLDDPPHQASWELSSHLGYIDIISI